MRYQRAELPLRIDSMSAAEAFFAGCLADCDPTRESLFVAHVDGQARCLHLSRHDGDESGAEFPYRSIISDSLDIGSAGLLLAHNHPSGNATPSEADCRVTRKLAAAIEALDCVVIDHLVFAGDQCTSFRQMGLL